MVGYELLVWIEEHKTGHMAPLVQNAMNRHGVVVVGVIDHRLLANHTSRSWEERIGRPAMVWKHSDSTQGLVQALFIAIALHDPPTSSLYIKTC